MSAVLILSPENTVYPESGSADMRLFVIGIARLGRFIAFVPGPVIVGFTSGVPTHRH